MQDLLLYAAALIVAELLHRRDRDLDTDDADRFSAAGPVAVAAAIMLEPWQAFLVSSLSVGAVRRVQGDGWRDSTLRALSLGGAALAGGYAYLAAGSEGGSVALPDDLMALALLGVAFTVVKTLLVRLPARASTFEPDLRTAGAEIALGAALVVAVDGNLWNAALLLPALVLIEHLSRGTIALRHQVASALEKFANSPSAFASPRSRRRRSSTTGNATTGAATTEPAVRPCRSRRTC